MKTMITEGGFDTVGDGRFSIIGAVAANHGMHAGVGWKRRQRGWDKNTVFGMSDTSALKMGLLGTVFLERFSKQEIASQRFVGGSSGGYRHS